MADDRTDMVTEEQGDELDDKQSSIEVKIET